jgi:hypothetical protein
MYIYLITIIVIVSLWFTYECCPISYMELLFYNVDLENTPTTFHSTFYSLFNDYTGNIMISSGILYLITVTIVLYKCKMPRQAKIVYYFLFLFLFFDSYYKSRIYETYYSTENKQLLYIYNLYKGKQ